MDSVRQFILAETQRRETTLREVSLALKKNHAYLQQFINRGVPAKLPEDVRHALARHWSIPEAKLRLAGGGRGVTDSPRRKDGRSRAGGTAPTRHGGHIESSEVAAGATAAAALTSGQALIPELAARGGMGGGGFSEAEVRYDGNYADPVKPEGWQFPATFMQQELRASNTSVLIIETEGDSMQPTIAPGERVIVNTRHREPSPDGIYAVRDTFGNIVVKRLQVLRGAGPPRIRIISDNPNHQADEVGIDEITIVGKVWGSLRRL